MNENHPIQQAFAVADWLRRKEVFLHRSCPAPLESLLSRQTRCSQVLDCGTGIGSLIKYLAGDNKQGAPLLEWDRVVGVDRNEHLLYNHARTDLAHVHGLLLLQGDVADLGSLRQVTADGIAPNVTHALDDNTFDLVLSQELLEHLPNPVGALREMWRVLKPGGTLLCLRNAEREVILEPAHQLDERIISNFDKYVFGSESDHYCGRRLWRHAIDAGLSLPRITSTPWLVHPPFTRDEVSTLRHIVEVFFVTGSTPALIPDNEWQNDGVPSDQLEDWRKERVRQIDRGELVFYVNSFDLAAEKEFASVP